MSTLHEVLLNLTNEALKERVKLLGVKPASPQKAALVDAVKNAFDGENLRAQWNALPPLAQTALAEACHDLDRRCDSARFQAKYGAKPPFSEEVPGAIPHSWGSRGKPTRLWAFFAPPGLEPYTCVPDDLAARLREFVPAPAEATVNTSPDPPGGDDLWIRETEFDALGEVMAVLRLAERGEMRASEKTGMPTPAGRKALEACMPGGDLFPPEISSPPNRREYEDEIGMIKPLAWSRLLLAAGLVSLSGGKSKLTPAGVKILKTPPHQILREIWARWLETPLFDEFNRIDAIKGQSSKGHMTAKPPRRQAITAALRTCPTGAWIKADDFSSFMLAAGWTFEVSHNPWKLYLGEARYGALAHEGHGGWKIVQYRYVLCLLFEYAATLGLIDIAYVHPKGARRDFRGNWGSDELQWLSRYDGLRSFRITPLGAFCLGMTAAYQPTRPLSSLELTVLPGLHIRVVSGAAQPSDLLLLETWAEPLSDGSWRLDFTRGRDAVERGQSSAEFGELLQRYDFQPLPETVWSFLETCERDGKALRFAGEAVFFDCRDAATTGLISSYNGLSDLCFRCSNTRLAVPAANVAKFRKLVRALGLGIV